AAAAGLSRYPALVQLRGMARTLGWGERRPLLDDYLRKQVLDVWGEQLGCRFAQLELDFAAVRELSPVEFLQVLRDHYGVSGVVAGLDFRFGRDRSGDCHCLALEGERLGLQVRIVPPVMDAGAPISTTRVRAALAKGDMALVARLLGRPYLLHGHVVPGDQRGRQLGFPTANCSGITVALPEPGVYACLARLADGSRHPAAVNIGHLPSIAPGRPLSVEAHLLDYQGDCYHQSLELALLERLRPEQRFPDLDALRSQLHRDIQAVRACTLELPDALPWPPAF
ncbi:MAG: riboflavin kinase, partial [Planctomycetota bacterium]